MPIPRPDGNASRALGGFFLIAGILHFTHTRQYEAIMPPWVPARQEMVYLSGAAEIAGALGALLPATRAPAGWWLTATLVAVFPANVHMALHPEGYPIPPWLLWARLPLQGALVAWALWATEALRRRG